MLTFGYADCKHNKHRPRARVTAIFCRKNKTPFFSFFYIGENHGTIIEK